MHRTCVCLGWGQDAGVDRMTQQQLIAYHKLKKNIRCADIQIISVTYIDDSSILLFRFSFLLFDLFHMSVYAVTVLHKTYRAVRLGNLSTSETWWTNIIVTTLLSFIFRLRRWLQIFHFFHFISYTNCHKLLSYDHK